MRHYEPPEQTAGTVFDPTDDVFGPIMAALQSGDFERARDRLAVLIAAARAQQHTPCHAELPGWGVSFDATDDEIRRARGLYGSDEVEVDENAQVSRADDGAWVGAWVWLENDSQPAEKGDGDAARS